jgi:hypothetical protein
MRIAGYCSYGLACRGGGWSRDQSACWCVFAETFAAVRQAPRPPGEGGCGAP